MSINVDIGVYWPARSEPLETCVARARRHFAALADASPNLEKWFRKARSKAHANDLVDTKAAQSIEECLLAGRNRKDFSGELMPELGYRLELWNGGVGGWPSSTTISCGMANDNRNFSNVALLSLWFEKDTALPPEKMIEVLVRLIEIWEPDRGYVFQLEIPRDDEDAEPRKVSYATYRSTEAEIQRRWFFRDERPPVGQIRMLDSGRLWIDEDIRSRFELKETRRAR